MMFSQKIGKAMIWGRLRKKLQRQGARVQRSEAYFGVRRNDEGGSATQHMDFLRSRQKLLAFLPDLV